MYYHEVSPFQRPPVITGQNIQPRIENGETNNFLTSLLIGGTVIIIGILIVNVIRNYQDSNRERARP